VDGLSIKLDSYTIACFFPGEGLAPISRGESSLSTCSLSFPILKPALRLGVLGVLGVISISGSSRRANPRCDVVLPSTGETPAAVAAVDDGGVIGRLKGTLEKEAPAVTSEGPSDAPISGVVEAICARLGVIAGLKDELSDSRSLALLP
jgi:hypothetical protein